MEGDETCKTQLSHYPHHLIRAGMCEKIIVSILSFAHALQTPNVWTGNTFGFSNACIPSETDPLRGEFYASSTFVHFLPKGYSRTLKPKSLNPKNPKHRQSAVQWHLLPVEDVVMIILSW
jgi:hypothetical protein